jgi:hypothetical protein
MRCSAMTSMAVALLLAAPVSAQAEPAGWKALPARHLNADRTVALAPSPGLFSLFAPGPVRPERHETDGLSRNPDDCAIYGCVANN